MESFNSSLPEIKIKDEPLLELSSYGNGQTKSSQDVINSLILEKTNLYIKSEHEAINEQLEPEIFFKHATCFSLPNFFESNYDFKYKEEQQKLNKFFDKDVDEENMDLLNRSHYLTSTVDIKDELMESTSDFKLSHMKISEKRTKKNLDSEPKIDVDELSKINTLSSSLNDTYDLVSDKSTSFKTSYSDSSTEIKNEQIEVEEIFEYAMNEQKCFNLNKENPLDNDATFRIKRAAENNKKDFENSVADFEGFENLVADFEGFENLVADFEGFENLVADFEGFEFENNHEKDKKSGKTKDISQLEPCDSTANVHHVMSSVDHFGKRRVGSRLKRIYSPSSINVERLFKCFVCNFETDVKQSLRNHLLVHSNRNCFKCCECSYATYNTKNLRRHLLQHSDQTIFKCSNCIYSTKDNRNYQRHLLIHFDEKTFKCSRCKFQTNYRYIFFNHLIRHNDPTLLIKCAVHEKRRLKCFMCSFASPVREEMTAHLFQHSKSKWLKCSECNYTTIDKNNLKRHVLNHSGSKFLKCLNCTYETNDRGHLKRHRLKCKAVAKSNSILFF